MTLHILRGTGKRRAVDRVRELEAENTELACKVIALTTENATLQHQLDTAGIQLSGARLDLEAAVAEIRRLQQRVIRGAATEARLTQALRNARPRITAVPAQAEEPLSPAGVLPLTIPSQQKEVA